MESCEVPDLREALAATLHALEERAAGFMLRPHHLIPDLLLYNYAVDVRQHCQATLTLANSEIPRTSYACARAATEATQDLAMLVKDPDAYDQAGATAYVWSLLETERLQARFIRARRAMGVPIPADLGLSVEQVVSGAIAKWAPHNARADILLQTALTTLRGKRRRHWTGMKRSDLPAKILDGSGHEETEAAMDALYGDLSAQSHPGIEWGRQFHYANGRVSIRDNPEHRLRPIHMAWSAAYGAWWLTELALNPAYIE